MELVQELWDIQELINKKDQINPKPQYQRTPVWTFERKAFLIDSILRGYDLPKFYLKYFKNGNPFEYEVADGQQRIRTIWEFYEGAFPLGKNVIIDDIDLSGNFYNDLSKNQKTQILKFDLNFTIILSHKDGELNELFTRLQKGVSLNPVELRHAMYSNIGFYMSRFLDRKSILDYFTESKIPDKRFKHQDYIDHIIALANFKNKKDLKAAAITQLYIDYADSEISEFKIYFDRAEKVIKKMSEINSFKKGQFKNKWAFVDVFWLLYKNVSRLQYIDAQTFANKFKEFESDRVKFNSKPEKVLTLKRNKFGKKLYDYIQAFNKEGAKKENISIRGIIFEQIFAAIL